MGECEEKKRLFWMGKKSKTRRATEEYLLQILELNSTHKWNKQWKTQEDLMVKHNSSIPMIRKYYTIILKDKELRMCYGFDDTWDKFLDKKGKIRSIKNES